MLSILVVSTKGGCGKTTVSTTMSTAFVKQGLNAALVDCDRQKSSFRWAERRPVTASFLTAEDWSKAPGTLHDGFDRVIFDAPAALPKSRIADLMAYADVIVVPVQPSSFDRDATKRLLKKLHAMKPISKGDIPVLVVGNRVRPGTHAAKKLKEFLDSLGHEAVAILRDTQYYPDLAEKGMALFDYGNAKMRAARNDWKPLLDRLDALAAK